jgi:hypothetical protein
MTARGRAEKPPGSWMPEQVVDFMLAAIATGDFYIICPDNDVTRDIATIGASYGQPTSTLRWREMDSNS